MIYRIISGFIGALMAATAAGWLLDPETAAGSLGMSYMDGLGRSTLVGDMSAFLSFWLSCVLPERLPELATTYGSAGLLLLLAAVFRTTAWALHGADFATTFIVFEIVMAGLLFFCAAKIGQRDDIV